MRTDAKSCATLFKSNFSYVEREKADQMTLAKLTPTVLSRFLAVYAPSLRVIRHFHVQSVSFCRFKRLKTVGVGRFSAQNCWSFGSFTLIWPN